MFIQSAIERRLTRPQRQSSSSLYVGDIGYHPYKAMDRILNNASLDFDQRTLTKMRLGVVMENETFQQAAQHHGHALDQFPLYDSFWSGYADMVFNHDEEGLPVTIVEHKTTDPKYWGRFDHLKTAHMLQLWLYGELYKKMYKKVPSLILYYRAWEEWAEYKIKFKGDGFQIQGMTTQGKRPIMQREEFRQVNAQALKEELQSWRTKLIMPPRDKLVDSWDYADERVFGEGEQ